MCGPWHITALCSQYPVITTTNAKAVSRLFYLTQTQVTEHKEKIHLTHQWYNSTSGISFFKIFFSTTIYQVSTFITLNSFYKYVLFPHLKYLRFLAHPLDGSRCLHEGAWPVRRVSSDPGSHHLQLCELDAIACLPSPHVPHYRNKGFTFSSTCFLSLFRHFLSLLILKTALLYLSAEHFMVPT